MGFEILGRLGLDSSSFTAELNRASARAKTFEQQLGSSMGSTAGAIKSQLAAAFSVGFMVNAGKQAVEYGSKIADMSKKLDVSTDALQEFEFAANLSGASLEDIGAAFRGLAKAREAALGGDTGKLAAFSNFGFDKAALQAA